MGAPADMVVTASCLLGAHLLPAGKMQPLAHVRTATTYRLSSGTYTLVPPWHAWQGWPGGPAATG